MATSALSEHLRELHEELEGTSEIDPEAREQLRVLLDDIRSVLDRSDAASTHTPQSLTTRLEEQTREFEASHPTLSATIGRLVDTLSNLGI